MIKLVDGVAMNHDILVCSVVHRWHCLSCEWFRVIIPTYPNGHLPVWPIFGSLWPPSVSHYGQLHRKGDIRQVIINKDLAGRYVKLP